MSRRESDGAARGTASGRDCLIARSLRARGRCSNLRLREQACLRKRYVCETAQSWLAEQTRTSECVVPLRLGRLSQRARGRSRVLCNRLARTWRLPFFVGMHLAGRYSK
jgi:hypothetical protein